MKTIQKDAITLELSDAIGRFASCEIGGELVGVSLIGEDEVVRRMSDITPGCVVEAGSEAFLVVEGGEGAPCACNEHCACDRHAFGDGHAS